MTAESGNESTDPKIHTLEQNRVNWTNLCSDITSWNFATCVPTKTCY